MLNTTVMATSPVSPKPSNPPETSVRLEVTQSGTMVLLCCARCDGEIRRVPFGSCLRGREAERVTVTCPHCGAAAILRL